MFETVTVEQAISKGRRTVSYPGIAILLGTLALTFAAALQKTSSPWVWLVGIVSSLLFSWLFWSTRVTKWKIWAFDNVRNVHELKKRAIEEKLIWPNDSFFNKTEIWNKEDKQKWELLQDKFLKNDDLNFEDDLSLPGETIIYYSKAKNLFEMFAMLACMAGGIFLIAKKDSPVLGTLLSLMGAFFAYREFREATNKKPQIIVSDKGIETITTKFYNWQDIQGEDVEMTGSGKSTRYYLVYEHPDGVESLMIDDYNIGYKKLRSVLKVYRGRNVRNAGDK